MKIMTRGCLWFFALLTQIPVSPLHAAGFLLSGHVPPPVERAISLPLGRLPGTNQLHLALSLPLRNPAGLTNLLAAIYRPGDPEYHHFLRPGGFAARFGPAPDDYASVIHFARTNGLTVSATHSNRLLVDVTGRVADIERALHVQLHWYRHPTEPRNFFAPDSEPTVDPRLPLLHVSGLDSFYRPHPNLVVGPPPASSPRTPLAGSGPNGYYLGNDFRQAYVPGTTLTGAGQNLDLLQFDNFTPADITNYAAAIGLSNVPPITVIPVDGGFGTPGANRLEVSLDIEMVLAMAPGISNLFVYEAPNPSPWVDILSQMADDDLAPQASCSWSGGGPDPASEQVFQQMAAQGQSFFCAAGDAGAFTNVVQFPSSSPNITQVGGTSLVTDTNQNYVSESVWNRGNGSAGGGGVALSVDLPVWQMGVDMVANGGSTAWRNVPDVALTAENVYVVIDGQGNLAAGTSCAAPLWAAFTALANQQAAQLGEPPVGFLNPAIYGLCRGANYPALFHDITSGNNTNLFNPANYYASPGFDLCTGWGTPMGTNLINALASPDPLGILPQNVFITSGMVGGPFPQTNWLITLTNSGPDDLQWSLGNVPAWLALSLSSGSLAANDSTNLTVEWLNPDAFAPGSFRAALMFTNLALSRIQNVLVRVDIGQSIVQNGGFETGDFTGWTLVGDTITIHSVYDIVATDADYPDVVHSGNYGAFLGENGFAATLTQVLPTIPGQPYLISFWLDNPQAGSIQTFSASWNGTVFTNLLNPPAFTWSNFQFTVIADDTNSTLQFAAENDPNYFGFDDVSVMPLPQVVFTSFQAGTNGFQFSWPSQTNLNYLVQYTTDLTQGVWQNLASVIASTNVMTFVDTNGVAQSSQGFYRLLLLP